MQRLEDMGLQLFGTPATASFYQSNGVGVMALGWPDDPPPNVITAIREGWVDFVLNIPKSLEPDELDNDFSIRRTAADPGVQLLTNAQAGALFVQSLHESSFDELTIRSYGESCGDSEGS